ncbi:hypothetical protein GCM10023149_14020 [Mucilaginibacter gynuensis]|uniref:Type IX secretion system PorP/SprF family membrane protein n=1 Tax=Mucilaginibacter gynuensis TaxID=1302236 RepID=A0ABP8G3T7_9SPHI
MLSLLVLSVGSKAQQFKSFNQYSNNLVPFNPAYSLVHGDNGAVNSLLRKQFTGIEGAPTTVMVNGYLPLSSIGATAGLMIQNDQVAIERLTELNAFFAKSIQLAGTQHLGVSINAGYRFYRANYTSLDPTGADPNFRNNIDDNKPNIGFGVMYYSDKFYLGLSLPRLTIRSLGTGSQQTDANFRNSYYLTGAYVFDLSDDIKLKPATLVNYTPSIPVEADISAILYTKEVFGIGANYNTRGSIAGILSFNVNAVQIGYSYQVGTSRIAGFGNGIHEIMLGFRFGSTAKESGGVL